MTDDTKPATRTLYDQDYVDALVARLTKVEQENRKLALDCAAHLGELMDVIQERDEALAREAKLREALEGIWRCTIEQNATDDEARGWIEVQARDALSDHHTGDKDDK